LCLVPLSSKAEVIYELKTSAKRDPERFAYRMFEAGATSPVMLYCYVDSKISKEWTRNCKETVILINEFSKKTGTGPIAETDWTTLTRVVTILYKIVAKEEL
jgi:hypothetical protein